MTAKNQQLFKLVSLKFSEHPYLGDAVGNNKFQFLSEAGLKVGPYSSVMIGPNGAGKSQILRLICDIFEDIEWRSKLNAAEGSTKVNLRYNYEIVISDGLTNFVIVHKFKLVLLKNISFPLTHSFSCDFLMNE
jgi:ABC-type polysaccharide/polyol phosphate transport system ATPase subunit